MAVKELDGRPATYDYLGLSDVTAGAPLVNAYRYPIPRGCKRVACKVGTGFLFSFDKREWRGYDFEAGAVRNWLEVDVPAEAAYVWHTHNSAVEFLFGNSTLITRPKDPPAVISMGGSEWKKASFGTFQINPGNVELLSPFDVPGEAGQAELRLNHQGQMESHTFMVEASHDTGNSGVAVLGSVTIGPGQTGIFLMQPGAARLNAQTFSSIGFLPRSFELHADLSEGGDNYDLDWELWVR